MSHISSLLMQGSRKNRVVNGPGMVFNEMLAILEMNPYVEVISLFSDDYTG